MRRYPQTLLFLLAYLLYNDGIQTVIALAAVYVEKELLLDTSVSIAVILLVQVVAFAGALLLGRLAGPVGRQARDPRLPGGVERHPGRRLLPPRRAGDRRLLGSRRRSGSSSVARRRCPGRSIAS